MSALLGAVRWFDQNCRLLYCALLTAHSRLLRQLIRTWSVAICGGLASWVWFCEWLGALSIYGLVGALVMAALSVRSPRPGAKQLMVAVWPSTLGRKLSASRSSPRSAAGFREECKRGQSVGDQI
jgi:hypothetical protein